MPTRSCTPRCADAGRLARRPPGGKGLFVTGIVVFAAGALARSLAVLLAARVVQGAGSALAVACSLAIIRGSFADERRRAAAIGIWSTSSGVRPPSGGRLGRPVGPAQAPLFTAGLHNALRVSGISLLATGAAVAALTARRHPRLASRRLNPDIAAYMCLSIFASWEFLGAEGGAGAGRRCTMRRTLRYPARRTPLSAAARAAG